MGIGKGFFCSHNFLVWMLRFYSPIQLVIFQAVQCTIAASTLLCPEPGMMDRMTSDMPFLYKIPIMIAPLVIDRGFHPEDACQTLFFLLGCHVTTGSPEFFDVWTLPVPQAEFFVTKCIPPAWVIVVTSMLIMCTVCDYLGNPWDIVATPVQIMLILACASYFTMAFRYLDQVA